MPEMKHNFLKGRMNRDLDERLVSDGEYREAMNIEVATSESDAVGTAQSVRGNILAYVENLAPNGGEIVGSYAHGRKDVIYLFISCRQHTWSSSRADIEKDIIAEYKNGTVTPVVVDIHKVVVFASDIDFIDPNLPTIWHFAKDVGQVDHTETTIANFYDSNNTLIHTIGVNRVLPNDTSIMFDSEIPSTVLADVDRIDFDRHRCLNFREQNIITGINVVDDLLFWTDNVSEPKKINITRSKQGTLNWNGRTSFLVYAEDGSIQSQKRMKEDHITMIKRSPLKAPTLEMYNNIGGRGNIVGTTALMNFTTEEDIGDGDTEIKQPEIGSLIDIEISGIVPNYEIGDILLFSNDSSIIAAQEPFLEEWNIRGYLTSISSSSILTIKVLSVEPGFFDFVNDPVNNIVGETFAVSLEQAKALFEFKFPRFACRYKFQDGEYSCFSPFSEIAFIPSSFKWNAESGYNVGMVNQLRFLKIMDFVQDGIPKGVTSIDILYKESNSPNIYTVKTIKSTDDEWNAPGSSGGIGNTKGSIQLESEVIYATVPSNQLLRPWDNVPRYALGQEVIGNRVVYGNYVQNYNIPKDITYNIDIKSFIKSNVDYGIVDETYAGKPGKSIKSLRTYQLGVVYKDKWGRETPVLTNEKASFNIGKQQASSYNSLSVQVNNPPPLWAETFKIFIKETSGEYYNLAMDRWYEAEDGNIWMSFASADRNKIQEDTYLILKKEHDADTSVPEEGKYKVLAIDNNVPDYVKTERHSYGTALTDSQSYSQESNSFTIAKWEETQYENQLEKEAGLHVRLQTTAGSNRTPWYKINGIKIKKLSGNRQATVSIKGSFGASILELASDSNTLYDLDCEISQFREVMKPEFDGRFFVKVAREAGLINKISISGNTDAETFAIAENQRQYYIHNIHNHSTWDSQVAWWGSDGSWTSRLARYTDAGQGFFIDHGYRNKWTAGAWKADRGYGIYGHRTYGTSLSCHMELSIAGIDDNRKDGFGMGNQPMHQRNFYNKMTKVGTWFRWKEDPNQVIYRITKVKHTGDGKYKDKHGKGIYNYSDKKKSREYRSNKTRRIYIHMEATGYYYNIDKNGVGYNDSYGELDENVEGQLPKWIDPSSSIPGAFSPIYSGRAWIERDGGDVNTLLNITHDMQQAETPFELAIACEAQAIAQNSIADPSTTCFSRGDGVTGYSTPYATSGVPKGNFYLSQSDRDSTLTGGGPGAPIAMAQEQTAHVTIDSSWDFKADGKTNQVGGGGAVNTNKYVTIEVVERFEADDDKFASDNPAIFETEPKEDVDLDIYHEIDNAFPVKLNKFTNELLIPYGSTVSCDNPNVVLRNVHTVSGIPSNVFWNEGLFTGDSIDVTLSSNAPPNHVKAGQIITTTPSGIIPQWDDPTNSQDTMIISVDGDELILDKPCMLNTGVTQTVEIHYHNVSPATVVGFDDNKVTLSCDPTNPMATRLPGPGDPLEDLNAANSFDLENILKFTRPDDTIISVGVMPNPVAFNNTHNVQSIGVNASSPIIGAWTSNLTQFVLNPNTYNSVIDLNWFNCYSFANGVESDRIRDDFNAVRIDKGPKASTTLAEKYEEERRQNGLIYSGIYNSTSGVNNLNQFIQAEKITKDLNPRFGSIQKLHARDTDLITLCEDKVLKVLANKDAVYNADGNPQLVATNRVLGQAIPYSGEYGISKNPESFAAQSFRSYFTDKQRGTVLRLSKDGLVPISDHGMKDFFADNLKTANRIIGSYDVKKDAYNVTLYNTLDSFYYLSPTNNVTVSFGEKTNGWTSFKSFIQYGGVSLNNNYFTFRNGNMYRHHANTNEVATATFYDIRVNPYVDVLLNEAPGSVKSFGTINYEGSESRITQDLLDNEYYNNISRGGWFLQSGETNLQTIPTLEFKDKEGKYFSRIKGNRTDLSNLDENEFSTQGIDIASQVIVGGIPSWDCYDSNCFDPGTGLGQYQTLADCLSSCSTPIEPSWNCEGASGCVDPGDGSGEFNSISDCEGNCVSKWICGNNSTCEEIWPGHVDYNNAYISQIQCENNSPCGTVLNPPLWICGQISAACAPNCCEEVQPNDPIYSSLIIGNNAWLTQAQCSNICQVYGCTDDGTDLNFPGRPSGWVGPASNYYAGATVDDGTCIYQTQPPAQTATVTFKDDPSDH